ncbi:MAG TPA: SurA N-terminal domain-containing protein [Kofleriaceae bacterium]|jgi:hypothetical protein
MLESLRKQGASIAVYLIFGLLIVIFVINFAPNAGQGRGGGGCMGQGGVDLTVDGSKVSHTAWQVAMANNAKGSRQKVYNALEFLIRREILAQEAEKRGLRVNGDMVDAELKKGFFFFAAQRQRGGWFEEAGEEKIFSLDKLKGFVSNALSLRSLGAFREEQTRSMQAALMAEYLMDTVHVSRDEALSDFLFAKNTITYDSVAFEATPYKAAMHLTEADAARFLTGHEADVKAKFTADERTYKATKPAYKLRSICIAKAEVPAATPPAPAPTDGAGSGSAAAPAPAPTPTPAKVEAPKPGTMAIEDAKKKLEEARTQIAAGKLTFEEAAKLLATDPVAKAIGGYIGWRTVDNAQLGDKLLNDAVKAAKVGEMTPVTAIDSGVCLVKVDEKREGDLTFDQVKNEIAYDMAKDVWSKEAAKRAALAAYADATAGNAKNLEQVFPQDPELVKKKMQDQMMEQIQQQMQQQGMKAEKSGFIPAPMKDVPAAWYADANGSSAGSGSAAGSAAPAGAGSGSAAASTPPAATTTKPTALVASTDQLPEFGEVAKPFLSSDGPVPRGNNLPVIGDNKEAITALFDEMTPGMLGKKVYEVKDAYVLLQLKDKQAADTKEFDKDAGERIEELREVRAAMFLDQWLAAKCQALAKDGQIKPSPDHIRETDDNGKPLPTVYKPCFSFGG